MSDADQILQHLLENDDNFLDDWKDTETPAVAFRLVDGRSGFHSNPIGDAIYKDGKVEYQNDYRGQWFPVLMVEFEGKRYGGGKYLRRFERDAIKRGGGRGKFMISDGGYSDAYYTVMVFTNSME